MGRLDMDKGERWKYAAHLEQHSSYGRIVRAQWKKKQKGERRKRLRRKVPGLLQTKRRIHDSIKLFSVLRSYMKSSSLHQDISLYSWW